MKSHALSCRSHVFFQIASLGCEVRLGDCFPHRKITLPSSDPHHDIYRFVTGKPSGILSDISSGIRSGIVSGISSGILSAH